MNDCLSAHAEDTSIGAFERNGAILFGYVGDWAKNSLIHKFHMQTQPRRTGLEQHFRTGFFQFGFFHTCSAYITTCMSVLVRAYVFVQYTRRPRCCSPRKINGITKFLSTNKDLFLLVKV